jgi:uncharacterized protein (DUF58 family)
MIEPTERTLWLLVVVALVGLAGMAVPWVGDGAPVLLGMLVAACAVDVWLGHSPRVEVQRVLPPWFVQGRASDVVLAVQSAHAQSLTLTHSLPAHALVAGDVVDRVHELVLHAHERLKLRESITLVRRGLHRLGRVTVRARGPMGLMRRRARLALVDDARVLPDIARIAARAEQLVRGAESEGVARRRAPREGREFDALREYARGDDPRLIAWKSSARMGSLVVKKLRPESRQDLIVVLDVGRQLMGSHDVQDGGEPRLDVAVNAGLTLAAAGLLRGDRVGLLSVAGDVVSWAPPREGKAQLRALVDSLVDVTARAEEPDWGALVRFLLAHKARRALVVVLTDVTDAGAARGLAAAVASLRGRHVPVVLALADPSLARLARPSVTTSPQDKAAKVSPIDAAMPEAAARILEHRKRALAALAGAGAHVVDAPSPRAAGLSVEAYLTMKGQGRL